MSESTASPPLDVEAVRAVLRQVIDPEIGMNIVDLGLIYRIEVAGDTVVVEMTMTSPACPLGDVLMEDIDAALAKVLPPGLRADVRLVWSPPWEPSMMSEAAKRHLEW